MGETLDNLVQLLADATDEDRLAVMSALGTEQRPEARRVGQRTCLPVPQSTPDIVSEIEWV